MCAGLGPYVYQPETQMFENLSDDLFVIYERNDSHGSLVFSTHNRIHLVNLPDQSRPIPPGLLRGQVRIQQGGDSGVYLILATFASGPVAAVTLVLDQLFPFQRQMGNQRPESHSRASYLFRTECPHMDTWNLNQVNTPIETNGP